MKPITPCWLCREVPRVNSLMVQHENPLLNPCACFPFCDNCIYLEAWEEMQTRILEQRRKDFEAGAYFARHQEMGSGNPDWSQVRADYNSAFLDFSDDDVDDYPEINAFDDYIKEGA